MKFRLQSGFYATDKQATSPTRLVNIFTGKVESTESMGCEPKDVRYVIGSYIWHPEKLPEYPRLRRRERKSQNVGDSVRDYSNEDWEYTTDHFDEVVAAVKAASNTVTETPKFWIIEEDPFITYCDRAYPPPCLDSLALDVPKSYISEVYYLLVAEAHSLGVQYVWLDILCIDQEDPSDIAREIPRMTEYYRKSTRCVVVSEMLRRGYSHRPDRLGHDFLNPTYDEELPPENLTERHRELYGLEDEVIGWLVGFHQLRVRVFQETYLATSIVHRGRNIRLNTRDILTYGIRAPHTLGRHDAEVGRQDRCRLVHQKRLPICSAGGETFTANHAMALIRQQERCTLKENDYIFSILGLFAKRVRDVIPVHYDTSLAASSAILAYARVATGDVMALFMDEDNGRDSQGHSICDAPSWLPRTFAQMSYQEVPHSAHIRLRWPDPQRPRVDYDGTLIIRTPYYRINGLRRANATDVAISTSQKSRPSDNDGKIHGFAIAGGDHRNPHEIEQDHIIFEVQVLPSMTVNLYFKSRLTRGEMAAWRLLKKATDAGKAVMACMQTSKHIHHWLVLVANDEGGNTWKIVGHLETGHIHEGINWNGENAPPSFQFYIP